MIFEIGFVLLAAALAMLVIPRIIFPLDEVEGTALDRAIAGGVWMTALTVAAMYILGLDDRLLETAALIAVYAVTWWILKGRHRERGRIQDLGGRIFHLFDEVEAKGVGETAQGYRKQGRVRGRISNMVENSPSPASILTGVALLVVIGIGAWMRFSRAFSHIELVPQDSYLALSWTTFLNKGRILADGTYPQGTYMWMSLLDRLYPLSTYSFVRFAGPLMNSLELIVLYWATSRASRSRVGGVLAAAVFAFFAGNPHLFVIWDRQIGAMTQEFALAFAIASLVFAGKYMSDKKTVDLTLAGAALFVAATSNALVIPFLALAHASVFAIGFAARSWDFRSVRNYVLTGLGALAGANLYFVIGFLRGIPLAQSFDQYNPTNETVFDEVDTLPDVFSPGNLLEANTLFQLGAIGALIAIIVGFVLLSRRPAVGRVMAATGTATLAMLLFCDLFASSQGPLFRVRQTWIAAELVVVGIGLGLGALATVAAVFMETQNEQLVESPQRRVGWQRQLLLEGAALGTAGVLFFGLFPKYSDVSREVNPSGYPAATRVSLMALEREQALTFTFVGVSEQYQEVLDKGFNVESWVFARDVSFSDARDPGYELSIPTPVVYVFAEKRAFDGPQACPYGPTQEYYRSTETRERIMTRITKWMEVYAANHQDVEIVYEDRDLRVYRIERQADVQRAMLAGAFTDYTWYPGEIFQRDSDITSDRVTRDIGAPVPPCAT